MENKNLPYLLLVVAIFLAIHHSSVIPSPPSPPSPVDPEDDSTVVVEGDFAKAGKDYFVNYTKKTCDVWDTLGSELVDGSLTSVEAQTQLADKTQAVRLKAQTAIQAKLNKVPKGPDGNDDPEALGKAFKDVAAGGRTAIAK